jgi:tripartite-type tricarboxylate transporter receptor subunit TctC
VLRIVTAVATLAFIASASAQESPDAWPSRPITLIAPFAAGGGNDVLARILAPPLGAILKQPVVVEK